MSTPLDPLFILTPPKIDNQALPLGLWKGLTASLATRFGVGVGTVRKLLPECTAMIQFGRVERTEGGDVIHARDVSNRSADGRDMSFVRVCVLSVQFVQQLITS
jgi:hypothetical protein